MIANSSRRRVDQESASSDDQNAANVQAVYEPLNTTSSSTRFLAIQPANLSDDRIACEVSEITFGELPVFEALSYQWGDRTAADCILLNGVECKVKQNLFDALIYLRGFRPAGALFWIDALCINQVDRDECNAQVRLMRTIYFRASAVIVWLGKKYEEYAERLPQLQAPGQMPKSKADVPAEAAAMPGSTRSEPTAAKTTGDNNIFNRTLAEELYRNSYWDRVWIVQEVGLAAEIIVCFGRFAVKWDHFINWLAVHKVGDKGPLKLHEQRCRRYKGSCRLLQLLHDYRGAQCQDPKDKVYGLVGLAADARFFPIDYNKSRFEIWKDVMEFANHHKMFTGEDIISTGRLVKYLLMGSGWEPLGQILQSHAPVEKAATLVDKPDSPKVFQVPAKVLGCVRYLGPPPNEMANDPSKQELWEAAVQDYGAKDAGCSHRESDMLLRKMVMPNGSSLTSTCVTYPSIVQWSVQSAWTGNDFSSYRHKEMIRKWQTSVRGPWYGLKSEKVHEASAEGVRLYQLESLFEASDWKMGVASDTVRIGDLICWVASSRMAIVLRPQLATYGPSLTCRAVGTAAVAKDLRVTLSEELEGHGFRYASFPTAITAGEYTTELMVHLDAAFVFILLESDAIFKKSAT